MKNSTEQLESAIRRTVTNINSDTARLNENFYNELEWVTETLLSNHIRLMSYRNAIKYGIELEIIELKKHVSRSYNVIGTSTCQIRNFKTALEFKTKMELITELESYTK
jgi:hypothetical protein